jgi:hypothetical protein
VVPSALTTTRSEKPAKPPFRVTVNGQACCGVVGILEAGVVGLPPEPEVESLPHPVRTRPAVAISAAYRIVFTPPSIPPPR